MAFDIQKPTLHIGEVAPLAPGFLANRQSKQHAVDLAFEPGGEGCRLLHQKGAVEEIEGL